MDIMTNTHRIILLYFLLYFGFQIFAQIWGKYLNTGIPISKNYIQNFINTLVLIGLVIYFGNPQIPLNRWITITIIITYVFMFLYCYAKNGLDEESVKDSKNGTNNSKNTLRIFVIIIYSIICAIYLISYLYIVENKERVGILIGGVLLSILYFTFYFFKNNEQTENKFPLALFIYPFLFLTKGVGMNKTITYLYVILFTSIASLWGFFGTEWFVGMKKEFEGTINRGMCKSYLGLSDDDLSAQPKEYTQTEINRKNINYIYIAVSLIFIVFVLALLFTYVSMSRIII